MKIYCIIPAYNEEKNILKVINEVTLLVDEVVVVDDASTDKTVEILKNNIFKNLIILEHPINRGQGAALQTGNEYAIKNGADIIVHFDADGQFVADEIKDIVKPIINGEADVVLGSRFLEKKSAIPFFKKTVIMPMARLVNKIFLGIDLTDPQSGFRAMSRNAAEKINIEQDRMAHCSEILAKTFSQKLRVKEVAIHVIYYNFGQKFSDGIKILKELFIGSLVK
ncbi:MAG: glycosyltransferase family 2 protein [Patescibacteria group bacterium]|nr:glycosyltransferase family 2 protein [Patescibacteria group bacterium]MDD4611260.1 glycosyltransferase family 2 protein [Patescibacteria group bacterium]